MRAAMARGRGLASAPAAETRAARGSAAARLSLALVSVAGGRALGRDAGSAEPSVGSDCGSSMDFGCVTSGGGSSLPSSSSLPPLGSEGPPLNLSSVGRTVPAADLAVAGECALINDALEKLEAWDADETMSSKLWTEMRTALARIVQPREADGWQAILNRTTLREVYDTLPENVTAQRDKEFYSTSIGSPLRFLSMWTIPEEKKKFAVLLNSLDKAMLYGVQDEGFLFL